MNLTPEQTQIVKRIMDSQRKSFAGIGQAVSNEAERLAHANKSSFPFLWACLSAAYWTGQQAVGADLSRMATAISAIEADVREQLTHSDET